MNRVLIDTAAWAALFLEKDLHHASAVETFQKLIRAKSELITSDVIFCEIINLVYKNAGKDLSILVGKSILGSSIVNLHFIGREHLQKCWQMYQRYSDKPYSFTQVSSFYLMKAFKIRHAFTFDRHFAQAGFEIV